MTGATKKIFDDAIELPANERRALGEALIQSATEQAEIDDAWRDEVLRRIEEMRSGKVEMVPFVAVRRRTRDALRH